MAQPYIGEIRMFGGSFAPAGWMFCAGQTLPIAEYETLFQLIGTTYGGDGQENFQLPDLQGRLPMHQGTTHGLAEKAGTETVTLTTQQIPNHTHPLVASTAAGSQNSPANNVLAGSPTIDMYRETSPGVPLVPSAVGPAGGSQPHNNLQPYLTISFIISLFGLFPSPT
jgi:microcystin-dependent protein